MILIYSVSFVLEIIKIWFTLSLNILDYKIILQCIFNFFQCTDVREVNLVYPIHNGSCHKQQMINNDKFNHGKPQLQLWIDSLNEMFLSRWTSHEQWNITFILLKTRREEGHQFVNLLPDRHAKFVIIQWITRVVPKLANLLKQENKKIDSL